MSPISDDDHVLAIDPGNIDSAYCFLRGKRIWAFGKESNADVLRKVHGSVIYRHLVVEMICSYGMPAGASLFDTCVFIGELYGAFKLHEELDPLLHGYKRTFTLMPRIQVKSHICHSGKATDSNIRQALIDLFGPQGKKSAPGPTFGISADVWSALAIAETFRSGDYTPYILSADKPENLPDKTA